MQAVILDKLQKQGRFAPEQAIALGEAIDMAVLDAQFVTVPILDARLAGMQSAMDARFAQMEARFSVLEARMDTKIQVLRGELEQKLATLKLQLIAAIVVSNVLAGPLGGRILSALMGGH